MCGSQVFLKHNAFSRIYLRTWKNLIGLTLSDAVYDSYHIPPELTLVHGAGVFMIAHLACVLAIAGLSDLDSVHRMMNYLCHGNEFFLDARPLKIILPVLFCHLSCHFFRYSIIAITAAATAEATPDATK